MVIDLLSSPSLRILRLLPLETIGEGVATLHLDPYNYILPIFHPLALSNIPDPERRAQCGCAGNNTASLLPLLPLLRIPLTTFGEGVATLHLLPPSYLLRPIRRYK